ncbi:hypothetical protein [Flavobacterium sp. UMI-01]|uniref:hypothetical protein n=1 Tax=Flavobacterium sp. UMI-01 TaxID=1441053 RepID=UPI001C7E07EF|nr:hypothetical protein [Flavobacterium sp. UMI-01]GIZ08571.1 hypothetical protein FUMI01_12980 [Flavobacterium sp. UMI-01]
MDYPTLQNTQINSVPFVFIDNKTVSYPVAPLVSAKFYEVNGVKTLKIRVTLYIDSNVTTNPRVETPTENGNQLELYFDYDYTEEIPTSCNVWYVELDYTSATVANIETVVSYLKDLDPETSRATKTTP